MISEFAAVRVGKSDVIPFGDSRIVKMQGCPCCDGRGYFLFNPFAVGGTNGAGGPGNMRQCLTCLDCETFWNQHGRLPDAALALVRVDRELQRRKLEAKFPKKRNH